MKNGKIFLTAFLFCFIGFLSIRSLVSGKEIITVSFEDLKDSLNKNTFDESFIGLSGESLKLMGSRMYYMNEGIFVTRDKNVYSRYSEADCNYEINQMVYLSEVAEEKGINLIYVNAPTKYASDDEFYKEFGIRSYANQNADRLVSGLRENGINVVDIREAMTDSGLVNQDVFYKTDHHWTTPMGVWVSSLLLYYLEEYPEYNFTDNILNDPNAFISCSFQKLFLGEQGQKLSDKYLEKDDVFIIYPSFETDYSFSHYNNVSDGTFESMFYDFSPAEGGYIGYYTYLGPNIDSFEIHNNQISNGKISIVGDSLTNAVASFLSMEVEDIEIINPRMVALEERDYLDTILSSECDTLIIMFSEGCLGAHDRDELANKYLFSFNNDN